MKDLILFFDTTNFYDIVEKIEEWFLSEKIKLRENLPLFIFDVWNTALYSSSGEIKIDECIYASILLLKENYNVFFLSYDSKLERIAFNSQKLNEYEGLSDIPKIFIKPKQKGMILRSLFEILILPKILSDEKLEKSIVFCDDSEFNLLNVKKYFTSSQMKKIVLIKWNNYSVEENEKACKKLLKTL